ncbi:PTS system protein [Klebsiella pneumoniae]|uniref:PTS system protein n=1 Tax=Klebsiella pneumoniae TaxID=573 RepID=A0A378BCB0_KLEPN|nr:PTS system protein [Klebsiella pneumoniae]
MTTKMISEETLQPQAQEETRITPRDLRRVFWRSFQMEFSWNYERQMNLAFVYALTPVLKKLYPRREELARSAEAASGFFQYHAAYRHPAAGDHHGDGREKQSAEKHGCHCD